MLGEEVSKAKRLIQVAASILFWFVYRYDLNVLLTYIQLHHRRPSVW